MQFVSDISILPHAMSNLFLICYPSFDSNNDISNSLHILNITTICFALTSENHPKNVILFGNMIHLYKKYIIFDAAYRFSVP